MNDALYAILEQLVGDSFSRVHRTEHIIAKMAAGLGMIVNGIKIEKVNPYMYIDIEVDYWKTILVSQFQLTLRFGTKQCIFRYDYTDE